MKGNTNCNFLWSSLHYCYENSLFCNTTLIKTIWGISIIITHSTVIVHYKYWFLPFHLFIYSSDSYKFKVYRNNVHYLLCLCIYNFVNTCLFGFYLNNYQNGSMIILSCATKTKYSIKETVFIETVKELSTLMGFVRLSHV